MQVTMQIIHQDGFPGLFRGMVPTLIREVPGYFFFFGGYELSRYLLTPKGKTVDEIGEYLSLSCIYLSVTNIFTSMCVKFLVDRVTVINWTS